MSKVNFYACDGCGEKIDMPDSNPILVEISQFQDEKVEQVPTFETGGITGPLAHLFASRREQKAVHKEFHFHDTTCMKRFFKMFTELTV